MNEQNTDAAREDGRHLSEQDTESSEPRGRGKRVAAALLAALLLAGALFLGLTALNLIRGLVSMLQSLGSGAVYLGWLFPIIALLNYFLFYGASFRNLLPESMRYRKVRDRKPGSAAPNPNWAANYRSKTGERPYRHKCTVCGRTDVQYPNLEFRYCSRCAGYHCYCIDHINNHVHITE